MKGPEETVWAPAPGTYLTDETALFRVAEVLTNKGQLLLELEHCATLELILCPARTVAKLGLRPVTPALAAPEASSSRARTRTRHGALA